MRGTSEIPEKVPGLRSETRRPHRSSVNFHVSQAARNGFVSHGTGSRANIFIAFDFDSRARKYWP